MQGFQGETSVRQPVGPGKQNDPSDVRNVHAGLERWWTFLGKRPPHLSLTYSFETERTIRAFQSEVLRQFAPTGVIMPGDETARKLAERPAPAKLQSMPVRPPIGALPLNARPGTPLRLPGRRGFDALSDDDYAAAAKRIGCEPLVIQALALQEGLGKGFDSFNRPVILYEPKHFATLSRPYTPDFRSLYPKLTHLMPKPHRYGPASLQWQHLQQAYLFNPVAALKAVSWGNFQMLGQYPQLGGFGTVEQMVSAMCVSEQEQLKAFVNRIQLTGMADAMKNKDWARIACGYNGQGYKENDYDTKLEAIYKKLQGQGNR